MLDVGKERGYPQQLAIPSNEGFRGILSGLIHEMKMRLGPNIIIKRTY